MSIVVRLRELCLLVLLFTWLNFAGYVARRWLGPGRGYPLTGLLAGMVSSTNATFMFARQSRAEPAVARPLALGAIAACTMLFPRVLFALLLINSPVARAFLPYVVAPLLLGAGVLMWNRSARAADQDPAQLRNPLQLVAALQMAATFQIVLMAVDWVERHLGTVAMMASGAVLGITDVDALTISMARTPGVTADVAAEAIAIGVLSNCIMKAVLAAVLGTRTFARLAGATVGLMAAVIGAALFAF